VEVVVEVVEVVVEAMEVVELAEAFVAADNNGGTVADRRPIREILTPFIF